MTPCLAKSKPKSKPSKLKHTDVILMMPQSKDKNKSTERRDESRSRRKTDSKLKSIISNS